MCTVYTFMGVTFCMCMQHQRFRVCLRFATACPDICLYRNAHLFQYTCVPVCAVCTYVSPYICIYLRNFVEMYVRMCPCLSLRHLSFFVYIITLDGYTHIFTKILAVFIRIISTLSACLYAFACALTCVCFKSFRSISLSTQQTFDPLPICIYT